MELLKEIESLENLGYDKLEIVEQLRRKQVEDSEIIQGINGYKFKKKWNGNIIGLFLILLAILFTISTQSTFGSFHYRFSSSGDLLRLNEWILKPFFTVTFLTVGIFILINKGFFDYTIKKILIIFLSIFLLSASISSSIISLLLGTVALVLISLIKTPNYLNETDGEILINGINNNEPKKAIMKNLGVKKWNGSFISILLLFSFILFFNSKIQISSSSTFEKLGLIDIVLTNLFKLILLSLLVTGLLIYINYKKFKISIFILSILLIVYLTICLFHENFQLSIIPSLIGLFSVTFLMINKKLLLTRHISNGGV